MSNPEVKKRKEIPGPLKFVFGGAAGMTGILFVHPSDVVKTRMQIQAKDVEKRLKVFAMAKSIFSEQGFAGLYKGIGAALLRQATYTTGRMGVYTTLTDYHKNKYQGTPSVAASAAMGLAAGCVGAFVGTPADVALVRMSADAAQPVDKRRNYKNVANALTRIVKEEGVLQLWSGVVPTVQRAMIINMSQLASYSQFKNYFKTGPLKLQEGVFLHFCASMCSGFLTTAVSIPMDMAKTRLQNQDIKHKEYRGTIDVISKVVAREGPFALWKGFWPYFGKLGPHTVLIFVFLEQFNRAYLKYAYGDN